jgi:hypothetical protein
VSLSPVSCDEVALRIITSNRGALSAAWLVASTPGLGQEEANAKEVAQIDFTRKEGAGSYGDLRPPRRILPHAS